MSSSDRPLRIPRSIVVGDWAINPWTERVFPPKLVTVDMDGTLFDAARCCGASGTFQPTTKCLHARLEVAAAVRQAAAAHDAGIIVVSWRPGYEDVTRAWFRVGASTIGIAPAAYCLPFSDDDVAGEVPGLYVPGSIIDAVRFKSATVEALRTRGHDIVAAFDDDPAVCRRLRSLGIRRVVQV